MHSTCRVRRRDRDKRIYWRGLPKSQMPESAYAVSSEKPPLFLVNRLYGSIFQNPESQKGNVQDKYL